SMPSGNFRVGSRWQASASSSDQFAFWRHVRLSIGSIGMDSDQGSDWTPPIDGNCNQRGCNNDTKRRYHSVQLAILCSVPSCDQKRGCASSNVAYVMHLSEL